MDELKTIAFILAALGMVLFGYGLGMVDERSRWEERERKKIEKERER